MPAFKKERLKILCRFLVTRYYYLLVLSLCPRKTPKALDIQVRTKIRKGLSLLHETPLGYSHAHFRDGGLGIPALVTTVSGMLLDLDT